MKSNHVYLFQIQSKPSHSYLVTSMKHFKELCKGISHFAIQRYGYFHHFIVADLNTRETNEIIEYASVSSELKGPGKIQQNNISRNDISFHIQERKLFVIQAPNYPTTDEEIEKAKNRALKRLGENAYSLSCNNCEHFATYVLTGKATSEQIENLNWLEKMAIDTFQTVVVEFDGTGILLAGHILTSSAAVAMHDRISTKRVQTVGHFASSITNAMYRTIKFNKLVSEQYINKHDYEMIKKRTLCGFAINTFGASMLGESPPHLTPLLSLGLYSASSAVCNYLLP